MHHQPRGEVTIKDLDFYGEQNINFILWHHDERRTKSADERIEKWQTVIYGVIWRNICRDYRLENGNGRMGFMEYYEQTPFVRPGENAEDLLQPL